MHRIDVGPAKVAWRALWKAWHKLSSDLLIQAPHLPAYPHPPPAPLSGVTLIRRLFSAPLPG